MQKSHDKNESLLKMNYSYYCVLRMCLDIVLLGLAAVRHTECGRLFFGQWRQSNHPPEKQDCRVRTLIHLRKVCIWVQFHWPGRHPGKAAQSGYTEKRENGGFADSYLLNMKRFLLLLCF